MRAGIVVKIIVDDYDNVPPHIKDILFKYVDNQTTANAVSRELGDNFKVSCRLMLGMDYY